MNVKVESTTDTPEQVAAVLAAPVKTVPAEAPAGEVPKEKVAETTEKVVTAKPAEEAEVTPPVVKKKGGFQKKIDKLTRRVEEAEARAARAEAGNDTKTPAAQPKKDADGKPTPDSFETHAEFVEALTDWKVSQKLGEKDQQVATERQKAQREEALVKWNERKAAATVAHPDFDEVVENADVTVSPAMTQAIVESDLGAEIAYYLGKNPDEANRIAKLSASAALREMGKIEARLENTAEKKETPPAEKAAPKPSVKPKPVAPVNGTAKTATKDPDEMNFQEFKQWRTSQGASH